MVAESSGNPSQLELRIGEFVSGGLPDGVTVSVSHDSNADGTPGFGELVSLTDRIRNVFGKGSPLSPEYLQGPGTSTTAGIDLNELDTRVGLLEGSLRLQQSLSRRLLRLSTRPQVRTMPRFSRLCRGFGPR